MNGKRIYEWEWGDVTVVILSIFEGNKTHSAQETNSTKL